MKIKKLTNNNNFSDEQLNVWLKERNKSFKIEFNN
jgi:hypothetical protein